jgi:hypothetical protein
MAARTNPRVQARPRQLSIFSRRTIYSSDDIYPAGGCCVHRSVKLFRKRSEISPTHTPSASESSAGHQSFVNRASAAHRCCTSGTMSYAVNVFSGTVRTKTEEIPAWTRVAFAAQKSTASTRRPRRTIRASSTISAARSVRTSSTPTPRPTRAARLRKRASYQLSVTSDNG